MKITNIEQKSYGDGGHAPGGVYMLTLDNDGKEVQRAFGRKWFPELHKRIEAKKIKVGDDLPGTVVNGIFKYDPPPLEFIERTRKINPNSKRKGKPKPLTYMEPQPRW